MAEKKKNIPLILSIIVLLMAIFIVPLGLAQQSHDTGEDIGLGSGDTNGAGAPTGIYAESSTCKKFDMRLATTYVPGGGGIEGGVNDVSGNHKVHTLEEYLNGQYANSADGNYATLASDINRSGSVFQYGDTAYVPALEAKVGKPVTFRITDTGAASLFHDNNGYQHIDVAASDKAYINGGGGDLGNLGISGPFVMYVGTGCNQGSAIAAGSTGSVPDFKQKDPKWASLVISQYKETMAEAGCAITSLADVLAANGVATDPGQMLNTANSLGLSGSMGNGLYPYMAKKYGLKYIQLDPRNQSQWNQTMTYLKGGALVIAHGGGSGEVAPFTVGGHFVVLTNYNSNGTITVNDPYRSIGPTAYSETLIRNGASTYPDGTVYISIFQK